MSRTGAETPPVRLRREKAKKHKKEFPLRLAAEDIPFKKTGTRRLKSDAYFDIALRHFMQIFIRFGVPATVVLMVRRLGTKSRLLTL
jgi:hypothetical protein